MFYYEIALILEQWREGKGRNDGKKEKKRTGDSDLHCAALGIQ